MNTISNNQPTKKTFSTWRWLLIGAGLLVLSLCAIALNFHRIANLPASQSLLVRLSQACIITFFCQRTYPSHYDLYFIGALVGLAVLGTGLWAFNTQKAARDPFSPKTAIINLKKRRDLTIFLTLAFLALLATGYTSYILFANATTLKGELWLVAALLICVTVGFADYAQGNKLFKKQELVIAIGYMALVVFLGAVDKTQHGREFSAFTAVILSVILFFTKIIPREATGLLLLCALAMAAHSADLDSWRYAWVGDEYDFWGFARSLASGSFKPQILSMAGVYGQHAVLTSYWQALTIKMYGMDAYGWRIGGSIAFILSALPLYGFIRIFTRKLSAFAAVAVYLSSQHIFGFSRAGYPATDIVLPITLSLFLLALAAKRGSLLGVYLGGLVAGLGIYLYGLMVAYIGATGLFFIIFFLTNTGGPKDNKIKSVVISWLKANTVSIIVLFIALALSLLPALLDTKWMSIMQAQTAAQSEVKTDNPLTQQILPNWIYMLLAFTSFPIDSHYVSGPHLDPASSIVMLIGLAMCVVVFLRSKIATWLLLTFLATSFVVGGLVKYAYPSIARTFSMVPFYAIFVGLGFEQLFLRLQDIRIGKYMSIGMAMIICFLSAILNIHQVKTLTPLSRNPTEIAIIIKMLQENPDTKMLFYGDDYTGNIDKALEAYKIDSKRITFVGQPEPKTFLSSLVRLNDPPYQIYIPAGSPILENWKLELHRSRPDLELTPIKTPTDQIIYYRVSFDETRVTQSGSSSNGVSKISVSNEISFTRVISPQVRPQFFSNFPITNAVDIAVGTDDLLYLVNSNSSDIDIYSRNGKRMRSVDLQLTSPSAIAISPRGDVYVLENGNGITLTRASPSGEILTRINQEALGIPSPTGMAIDWKGDVYLADPSISVIAHYTYDLKPIRHSPQKLNLIQPVNLTFVENRLIVLDVAGIHVFDEDFNEISTWKSFDYSTGQPPRFLPFQKEYIVMASPDLFGLIIYDLNGKVVQKIVAPEFPKLMRPIGITGDSLGLVFVLELEHHQVSILDWSYQP